MPEIKKASCLFCSLQCGYGMEMDSGVPVRVDLDTEAPVNLGSLCVRGHYNYELLLHPKRFLGATVNRRRVPWSSGVTKVAGRIGEIKGAGGGGALGVIVGTELSNEDYDAAVAFAATALGTNNVAVAYGGSDYPLLRGGGVGDAVPTDLDDATCFVMVGDVFWGHPCISKRIIEARHQARSNRVYTLNPYRTNTDWFADRHVKVRPGAEPLVLAALLSEMGIQGAPKVDVGKAADAAGLEPHEITAIAKNLKEQHKVVVLVSSRLGDSTSAYLTGMLAAKLAAAANGKYAPLFRGGNTIGAFERVGSAKTVPDILKDVADRKIKGLLVFGPDIVQLYPGALSQDDVEALEFLAASAIFENDVTKHSDVGLPQAVWSEVNGTYTGSFGISTTIAPLTAPQGDARTIASMLGDVAKGLGAALPAAAAGAKAEHPPVDIDVEAALAKIAAAGAADGVDLIEGTSPLHRGDGTVTSRMSFPQTISPYAEVWIGEDTAGGLGIEQGASVAVATDRGETSLIVTVTDRMPGGLVAIPTYVPDARGLMVWTPNAGTKWYDVSAKGAKVAPEA
jgi:anaerobic selenocysteine-containing dehydrogenase